MTHYNPMQERLLQQIQEHRRQVESPDVVGGHMLTESLLERLLTQL